MARYVLLLLIILAACETAVKTVPTANYTPTVFDEPEVIPAIDPCANVTCSAGQACNNGACTCSTGKLCGKKCIPNNACCKNTDCDTGNCVNQTCQTAKECAYGQELVNGACECAPGRTYCREQNRCIKQGDCCFHGNCPRFERCQPTIYRSEVCLNQPDKKQCRILGENRNPEEFLLNTTRLRMSPIKWLANGNMLAVLNKENLTLQANKTIQYNNASLIYKGIEELGGYCEPDEEKEEE
ncbi:hypothetical protein HY489_03355 [Candidatus Woesearchaeota archaeon]|nr:hypothetical protein [Candidatus Woesearchaeota archaeon]